MRLATFDIFDTTLIRVCGKPELVFELLCRRLYPEDTAAREAFYNWRIHAHGVTLAEIYSEDIELDFPEYTVNELRQAELDVESEMLTVNPAIADIITRRRNEGYSIKFLSDMYLPSDFLEMVLRREGCFIDGDKVIVSCEHSARKDTGTLYDSVRSTYHPTEWQHYGDNRRSDYKMARKKGVKAHLVDTSYTEIERKLLTESSRICNGWQLAVLAGLSRTARIKMHNTPEAVIAADFVVPTYLPFVMFVIDEAKGRGIERLQFLSRDGYIMLKMAEALAPSDIELNYLFVSRRSLMGAYLNGASADDYLDVIDKRTLNRKYVDDLLNMLQLSRDVLQKDYGITFDYNQITTKTQQEDFINKIFGENKFHSDFAVQCKKHHETTLDYLKQEGITRDKSNAYIDVGWLGTTRLMLSRLTGNKDITTYYMGARGDVYPRRYGNYLPYYRAGKLDTNATALIEAYFSASPYPSTVGYKIKDGKIVPIFANGKDIESNSIIDANIQAATTIATWIKGMDIDKHILNLWSKMSIESIASFNVKVNLTPFASSAGIGDSPLIRKLSGADLIQLIFFGKHITDFDRGSLEYTLGRKAARGLWRIAMITGRMRVKLFKILTRS